MARLPSARTLLLGGAALAAAAGAALKARRKGPTQIGPGDPPETAAVGEAAREPEGAPAVPVANADVAGPPENTATAVPAPDPVVQDPAGGIDEAAEEAAAAAEAANIGGPAPDYAGTELGEVAAEEERALAEAGEGESEGQEQAEADLADNAEPAAGDPVEGERAVEDAIEAQDDPRSGEDGVPT